MATLRCLWAFSWSCRAPCSPSSWIENVLFPHGILVTLFRNDSAESNMPYVFWHTTVNDHVCLKTGSLVSEITFVVKKSRHICSRRISALNIALKFYGVLCSPLKCLRTSKKNLDKNVFWMDSYEIQVIARVHLSMNSLLIETRLM